MNKYRAIGATAIIALGVSLAGCSGPGAADDGASPAAAAKSVFSQELHDALPDEIKKAGKIKVIGEPNGPWRVTDASGAISGFQTDMLAEWEQLLDIDFEVESATLPNVKLGVQTGRYDLAFGPILDTKKVQQDLTLIDYHTARPAIIFEKDNEVKSVTDLCGKTVAHLDGSAAMDFALAKIDGMCSSKGEAKLERLPQPEINSLVMAVESGRADFAATGAASASFAIGQRGDKLGRYVTSEDEFESDFQGSAVAVDNTELRDAMLKIWQAVFDNGVYEELMKKYNLTEIMLDKPAINAATK